MRIFTSPLEAVSAQFLGLLLDILLLAEFTRGDTGLAGERYEPPQHRSVSSTGWPISVLAT